VDFQIEALHKFNELHDIRELKKIGCIPWVQTNAAKALQSNTTLIVTPTSIQNAKQTSSRTLAPNNEHVNIGGSIVTPTGTTNSLDTSFFQQFSVIRR
jgi:hypothetical protein